MAESIVLDTSVLVKWFVNEHGSDSSRKIRSQQVAGKLVAHVSELALAELANALFSSGNLSKTDIANSVKAVMAINVAVHKISDVVLEAVEIAWEKNLTVYDAIHLALADKLNAKLATFDNEILRKAADIAVKP